MNSFLPNAFISRVRLYCRLFKSLPHLCLFFSTEMGITIAILLDLKPCLLAQWSYTMSRGSSLGEFLRYRLVGLETRTDEIKWLV